MTSRKTFSKRAGFTLVEVTIAGAMATVVAGIATALLVGVVRNNDAVHQRLEQIAIRSRLGEQFRADVARAKTGTAIEEPGATSGVELRFDEGHATRWLAAGDYLRRTASTGDHVDARESYFLGDGRRAELTISQDSPATVRCTIEPSVVPPAEQPAGGVTAPVRLSIVAVLARDGRLAESLAKATAPAADAPTVETKSP
jgi:type II secretory pathway pseudopilin PulG